MSGWVRRFFAIKNLNRASIPQAKRATGFEKEAPTVEYFNQALSEAHGVDYILGSAADVTIGNANVKWTGTIFQDDTGATVNFASGDRIAIVSLDGGSITFTPNNLFFDMEPDVEIDLTGITFTLSGAGHRGRLNFVNAPDNSIILSGSSTFLDIRTDNFESIVNSGQNDFLLNGIHAIQNVPNYENDFINSSFAVAQRGTSFVGVTDGQYTLDKMKWRQAGTMVFGVTQTSLALGKYAIRATCSTAQPSLGVADFAAFEHIIEGYNIVKYLEVGYAAVSIRVQSNQTGTFFVAFQNSGNDRSYVYQYTINAAATKETKTFVVPMNETGGTWNYTNGSGLRCFFVLSSGTNFNTTAEAWQTGNYLSVAGGTNLAANVNDYLEIDEIKIRPGIVQTGFFTENFDTELSLSQRYFEKTYDPSTPPGTITIVGQYSTYADTSVASVVGHAYGDLTVAKRAIGTPTVYSPATGAAANARNVSGAGDFGVIVVHGFKNWYWYTTGAGTIPTGGQNYAWHLTVDSDL